MAGGPELERILVAVDFGRGVRGDVGCERAGVAGCEAYIPATVIAGLELALRLAPDGALLLCHATPGVDSGGLYAGPVSILGETERDLDRRALDQSLTVLEALAAAHCQGVTVEFAVSPGVPAEVILEAAQRFRADLVIVGTSGRSRPARFFLGSTAEHVIRGAHCPVLTIPTPRSHEPPRLRPLPEKPISGQH